MSNAMFNIFLRTIKRRMEDGEELDAILASYPKLSEDEIVALKEAVSECIK